MKINDSVKIDGEETRGIVTGFRLLNGNLKIGIKGRGLIDAVWVSDDPQPTLPTVASSKGRTARLLDCNVPVPIAVSCYLCADPEREALRLYGRALDALRVAHGPAVDEAIKAAMEGVQA